MRIKYILLAVLCVISSCKKEHNKPDPDKIKRQGQENAMRIDPFLKERVDTFFERRHSEGRFNGVVLYADHGRVVFSKAYGYADFEKKKELTTNSIFQLASVSKQFTAAAIMLLNQRGVISYSDSITKFFPLFPYKKITIKQLLIHNSGLPNYMYFADDYWINKKLPINNMAVINLMTIHKPKENFSPGEKFNYSNTGYCILAAIVEKVSGMHFSTFMEKNFFGPLEMKSTFVLNGEIKNKDSIATGYLRKGKKAEDFFQNGVVGDKGVYSNVHDLLIWDQELYEGNILNRSVIEEAFIPEYHFKTTRDYGYGWRIRMHNNKKIAYHGGWWKGYRAYFIRSLEDRKTVIVLINIATRISFNVGELLDLYSEPLADSLKYSL